MGWQLNSLAPQAIEPRRGVLPSPYWKREVVFGVRNCDGYALAMMSLWVSIDGNLVREVCMYVWIASMGKSLCKASK